jgi:hypothetical protein
MLSTPNPLLAGSLWAETQCINTDKEVLIHTSTPWNFAKETYPRIEHK